MAKFKVGDVVSLKDGYSVPSGASGNRAVVVEVLRPAGGDFNYWLRFDGGREREQNGDHLVLANAARNAVIEKKLPPRGAGVYIEQQGGSFAVGPTNDGWSVANYGGEGVNFAHGFKTASEAKSWCASKGYKVEDVVLANAARSRNAYGTNYIDEGDRVWVVSEKKKGTVKSFTTTKGPQPIITVKYDDGSVGVADAKDIRVIPNSTRSRNAVVQKALNATGDGRDYYVVDEFGNAADGSKTPLPFDRASELFLKLTGSKSGNGKWGIIRRGEPASRARDWYGNIVSWNADTSVLRETAVNGSSSPWGFFVGEEVVIKRDPEKKKHRIKAIVGGDIILEGVGPRFDASELDTANYAGPYRTTNAVVAKALSARRVARNFTPQSEFEVGDVVRFRDSVRSVPHDETYTVVKVSGNNVTIKGGRDNSTSVEFKNNLETA